MPEVARLHPPIGDGALWQPYRAVYGVRALASREREGRLPHAGRIDSRSPVAAALDPAPAGGMWLLTGLGSRGLIHHSILAELLARAVMEGEASLLPALARRIPLLALDAANGQERETPAVTIGGEGRNGRGGEAGGLRGLGRVLGGGVEVGKG